MRPGTARAQRRAADARDGANGPCGRGWIRGRWPRGVLCCSICVRDWRNNNTRSAHNPSWNSERAPRSKMQPREPPIVHPRHGVAPPAALPPRASRHRAHSTSRPRRSVPCRWPLQPQLLARVCCTCRCASTNRAHSRSRAARSRAVGTARVAAMSERAKRNIVPPKKLELEGVGALGRGAGPRAPGRPAPNHPLASVARRVRQEAGQAAGRLPHPEQ